MYIKETPKRLIKSENGEIVYLVEWWCPECMGNGCKYCKFKGCMDGLELAGYNATHKFRNRVKEAGLKRRKKKIGM